MNFDNETIVDLVKSGIDTQNNLVLLFEQNKPLIKQVVKTYETYMEHEDLMQIAFLGLYEAVKMYDATKGAKFITFLLKMIKWQIIRELESTGFMVRIPTYLRNKINLCKRMMSEHEKEYGEKPSDEILRFILNVSKSEFEYLRLWINEPMSLDRVVSTENDSYTLSDTIKSPENVENDVIEEIYNDDLKTSVWSILKEYTTERENKIIIEHFKNNQTLQQIAQKENISFSRVQQIQKEGLKKLRQRAKKELLLKYEMADAQLYCDGFNNFKNHNFTSKVEDIAMKRIELNEKYKI